MKEYGEDLEKQLDDAQKKVTSIENKIRKRAKLVLEYHPDTIDQLFVSQLLIEIKQKDQEYVDQSNQTEMFKTNENEKD